MQHPDDSGYAIRGRFLTFLPHPDDKGDESNLYYETDGVIVIKEGRFQEVGPASTILPKLPTDFLILKNDNALIVPGFIDLHIHLPQTRVIASYGAQLLEWLENYAFLEERKFSDERYANQEASFFLDELLRNGTTSALVFGSVHPQSINALFDQASKRSMGLIAGKVMMDRNAPSYLRDTSQQSYDESKELIKKWHKRGRHRYAVTPRFAITSTEAQLEVAGTLLREDSSLFLQTHLSENLDEIQIVQKLFPHHKDYTEVYDHFGLLGDKSLFAHCLHLNEREKDRLSESHSVAVSCPTSNLFLGSGLFDDRSMRGRQKKVRTGLATDLGGGTDYSMLRTLSEFYKVQQLQGNKVTALESFYRITRGNAQALGLENEIGSLQKGNYADFILLDSKATSAMSHRMKSCQNILEELFIMIILGDNRTIKDVYVQGKKMSFRGIE